MAKTGTGKHRPVVAEFRDRIAAGDYGPGDWLPSEAGLMETHGVTRYSAREAIKQLAAEGLIVVVDGKGSYVRVRTDRARHQDPRGLTTTTAPATTAGASAGSTGGSARGAVGTFGAPVHDAEFDRWQAAEEPSTYRTTAGTDLALALGIPEHAPVFGVDRLLARPDTNRRMLHRLIVPMSACTRIPALAEDPFLTPDALYAVLHDVGVAITAIEHVRATAPAPDDITSLALTTGAAVLITRRVLHDNDGRVIAMEETRRNADDTQLTYVITPASGPAALREVNR